jgi:hypothetical protein
LLVQGHHGYLLCFLEISQLLQVDRLGDKGSRNATTVDVQTHLNMSMKYACFIDEAFRW